MELQKLEKYRLVEYGKKVFLQELNPETGLYENKIGCQAQDFDQIGGLMKFILEDGKIQLIKKQKDDILWYSELIDKGNWVGAIDGSRPLFKLKGEEYYTFTDGKMTCLGNRIKLKQCGLWAFYNKETQTAYGISTFPAPRPNMSVGPGWRPYYDALVPYENICGIEVSESKVSLLKGGGIKEAMKLSTVVLQ